MFRYYYKILLIRFTLVWNSIFLFLGDVCYAFVSSRKLPLYPQDENGRYYSWTNYKKIHKAAQTAKQNRIGTLNDA